MNEVPLSEVSLAEAQRPLLGSTVEALYSPTRSCVVLQGYLAHKKRRPP